MIYNFWRSQTRNSEFIHRYPNNEPKYIKIPTFNSNNAETVERKPWLLSVKLSFLLFIFIQITYSINHEKTIFMQLYKNCFCQHQNLEFLAEETLSMLGVTISRDLNRHILNRIQIGLPESSAYNLSWNMAHNITILWAAPHPPTSNISSCSCKLKIVAQFFEVVKSLYVVQHLQFQLHGIWI